MALLRDPVNGDSPDDDLDDDWDDHAPSCQCDRCDWERSMYGSNRLNEAAQDDEPEEPPLDDEEQPL
jgi:hypothetical protein